MKLIQINYKKKKFKFLGKVLVFSHWIVDFITWPTGPPLFPIEKSPEATLGLINFLYSSDIGLIIGINVIEFGSLITGIGIYILTKTQLKKEHELFNS